MTIFTCCTCPEPPGYDPEVDAPLPKYLNKCGCPTATFTCTSIEKLGELCGTFNPDEESFPPNVYKKRVIVEGVDMYIDGPEIETTVWSINEAGVCDASEEIEGGTCIGYRDGDNYYSTEVSNFEMEGRYCTQGPFQTCTNFPITVIAPAKTIRTRQLKDDGSCGSIVSYEGSASFDANEDFPCETVNPWESVKLDRFGSGTMTRDENGFFVGGDDAVTVTVGTYFEPNCEGVRNDQPDQVYDFFVNTTDFINYDYLDLISDEQEDGSTYSNQESEADALERAEEEEDTFCSSIYQLRINTKVFTVRTVKFSLELTNLCRGRPYEGCVRIRKRMALSGSTTGTPFQSELKKWEDVEPFTFGPVTPSSENTTDGITTTPEITDQDLVGGTEDARGWEYEIVSAHVWPVSVGCDCPTELGYTDPE